ncbi:adiponectin receptor 1b [Capsaspora owczarzaki ATCC 30864]|uniref:Adiponectin receptor 1b n=1 Tax=Capsaspora owczarzaki (strain ATCC 30864) TaxID=595528 RepID=A0A0D2WRJ1_CAPO3|nr:adiponectin receptor 1b [Capsaspora owczarzaki ATCC 30864]KJE94525.1 adiponectin receptor 1b [Capsaspora owczarzaki ATCC 30864]|eukprot:XP_004346843.1 adiponectin receptor 1b [Capsaspora owczarzaki ATCC 30864]
MRETRSSAAAAAVAAVPSPVAPSAAAATTSSASALLTHPHLPHNMHDANEMMHAGATLLHDAAVESVEAVKHATAHAIDAMATASKTATDRAHHLVERVEETVHNIFALYSFHHIPDWLRDNDFIIGGYRTQMNSFRACFNSMFYLHNETGNIYSHLIGFTIFLVAACCAGYGYLSQHDFADQAVFWIFFVAAMICLMMSTLFHLLFCHSPRMYGVFSRLDYTGIAILIAGSFYPFVYYCFYCHETSRVIYLSMITILGVACAYVACSPKYDGVAFRTTRMLLFLGMGASGLLPVAHYTYLYGLAAAVNTSSLDVLGIMALLYVSGAVIYVTRVPERFFPGKFDYWLHSHQVFHILVVAAALTHYYGVYTAMQHRKEFQCSVEQSILGLSSLVGGADQNTSSVFVPSSEF